MLRQRKAALNGRGGGEQKLVGRPTGANGLKTSYRTVDGASSPTESGFERGAAQGKNSDGALPWPCSSHDELLLDFQVTNRTQALRSRFDAIIAQNRAIITTKISVLERQGEAIFIADAIPTPHAIAAGVRREITHIHERHDHSLHCTLSPLDAKLVVSNGWGERHPLAGSRLFSSCYTMLYTPRSEEELEVVCRVVRASIAFMTGGRDVVG